MSTTEQKKNNIIILATYWNEVSWIRQSLKQIEEINPVEIIICDGCFDPKIKNRSTDGTYEIIEEWRKNKNNVILLSARRSGKISGLLFILRSRFKYRFTPLYFLLFFYYFDTNIYRVNQAATFNKMIGMSRQWKNSSWFMTYDADQFYSDETITKIKQIIISDVPDLMTASENTFFDNFSEFTLQYEKRNYNNMPHKIKSSILILPTRDIANIQYPIPVIVGKYKNTKKIDVGNYNHYKFKPNDRKRFEDGYNLGDRKKPNTANLNFQRYETCHPKSIISSTISEHNDFD